MDPQGRPCGPWGPHSATMSAGRPPAVACTVADHATGADPCDGHC
jgi:hypothetical protein